MGAGRSRKPTRPRGLPRVRARGREGRRVSKPADEPQILDDLWVPELIVDDLTGAVIVDGIVRVTLDRLRWTQPLPGKPVRIVVGRLALSVAAARRLITNLAFV